MKKFYISPSVYVIEIKLDTHIMAGSSISATVHSDDFDDENMTTLSRRGNSFWDDEE